MDFKTQYSELDSHPEILDEFDAAIPNRTISVKEAAFKYANGLPLDSFFHQPTNIPMRYDVFDILDRGNAYKRDMILGDFNSSPGEALQDAGGDELQPNLQPPDNQ